jgi:hypothetical protein
VELSPGKAPRDWPVGTEDGECRLPLVLLWLWWLEPPRVRGASGEAAAAVTPQPHAQRVFSRGSDTPPNFSLRT